MKTSNNSPADNEVAENDTPNALISDNDLLKFFNLERENVQDFSITRRKDGMYVNITLNKTWVQCPVCGHMTSRVKDYTDKKITHSVMTTTNCYIIYHARRYQCPHCKKTFYENNPFTFGGRLSVATVFNVLRDLKAPNATFTDVAKRYGISATSVINTFDKHVHISRRQLPECLALDEVYAFKSHDSDYVCVIMDYLDKKIVDVLPSRRKYDLLNYFMLIPLEERKKVKYVSFDMWETYRIITKQYFPKAVCAVDKFHVLQEFSRKLDKVRIYAMNSVKNTHHKISEITDVALKEKWYKNDKAYYVFKKFNWLLFKPFEYEQLDINCKKKFNSKLSRYLNFYDLLQIMLTSNSDLEEAYNLKLALYDFYKLEAPTKDDLNTLIHLFKDSNVKCMSDFGNTLINWKQEILNSFIIVNVDGVKSKINNALIENRNKVIKTIKRNSNGYNNWDRFRNRCLYSLNDDVSYFMYPLDKKKRD